MFTTLSLCLSGMQKDNCTYYDYHGVNPLCDLALLTQYADGPSRCAYIKAEQEKDLLTILTISYSLAMVQYAKHH